MPPWHVPCVCWHMYVIKALLLVPRSMHHDWDVRCNCVCATAADANISTSHLQERERPFDLVSSPDRHDDVVAELKLCGNLPRFFLQFQLLPRLGRQAVELRSLRTEEARELRQGTLLSKGLSIELNTSETDVAPGAPTRTLLLRLGVRGAVSAGKKFRVSASSRGNQRYSVFLSLKDREAEQMWAETLVKNSVAVVQEVVGGYRRSDIRPARAHELHRILCGDVFHDYF
mmetsp:Transcript_4577/g.9188  ORF Transcript_4577/g.9188 Transcript_4577/m.9188 type:complete len:230 (-) Transcript_4577:362-1051(-)